MRSIILIAHDIRSCHNVGSLLRTAEGFGVSKVYLTGYTPYPKSKQDDRLPHISEKLHKQISKTSLGAEDLVIWDHSNDVAKVITDLKEQGFEIIGLEQSSSSIPLPTYKPSTKIALLIGREVEGIEPELQSLCDKLVEIPMKGKKESFNVVQATAVALYHTTLV